VNISNNIKWEATFFPAGQCKTLVHLKRKNEEDILQKQNTLTLQRQHYLTIMVNAYMNKIYHLHRFTSRSPTVSPEEEMVLQMSKPYGSVQTPVTPLRSVPLLAVTATNFPP